MKFNISWRLFPKEEGFVPYISLANFFIPLYFILHEPPTRLWSGLILLAILAVLYREQFYRMRFIPYLLAIEAGIILYLGYAYHPVYVYLGFLLSAPLAKQSVRYITGLGIIFTAVALKASLPYFHTMGAVMLFILLPPLFSVSIMPFIIRSAAKYKVMAERLKAATEQLERMAQQEERQRIARELHDTLGHTLSLLALKGELTEKLISRAPERAAVEARDITETARSALKQMRELVTEMRVVRLADEYTHARALCAAAGIELSIQDSIYDERQQDTVKSAKTTSQASDIQGSGLPLSPLQETILAMCFREVLTNVVRHSQAGSCQVKFETEDGSVQLYIEDDGRGMDQAALQHRGGSGIAGLKQRLQLVDGHLELHSPSGGGLKVGLSIPRTIRNQEGG